MSNKTRAQTTHDILDQVAKAQKILNDLNETTCQEGATVRSRLNAAKAHIMRAIEKAQTMK